MPAFLDQFQTAIVGVVGFAGVILTLRHNAKLAKSERLERLEQERETVRVALLTELSIVRLSIQENTKAVVEAIEYNAERVDGLKTGMLLQPEPMTSAYNAFLPKIGLLGLETLRPAMYAYLAIETAWSRLVLWPDIEPIDGQLSIGWKYLPTLVEMWGNLIPDIDKAIVALGGKPEE